MDNRKIEEFCRNFAIRSINIGARPTQEVTYFNQTAMMVSQQREEIMLTITADQFERMLDMLDDMDPGRNPAVIEAYEQYIMLRRLSRKY